MRECIMFNRPNLLINESFDSFPFAGLEDAAGIDQFRHEGSLEETDATHHEDILYKPPPLQPRYFDVRLYLDGREAGRFTNGR